MRLEGVELVARHRDPDDVAVLGRLLRIGEGGFAQPTHPDDPAVPGTSRSPRRRPAHAAGMVRSTMQILALGSTHSTAWASGRMRRRTRSVVHCTVATVGMPRRS